MRGCQQTANSQALFTPSAGTAQLPGLGPWVVVSSIFLALSAADGPLASAAGTGTSAAWPATHRLALPPQHLVPGKMPTGGHGDALPKSPPWHQDEAAGAGAGYQALFPKWCG